MGYYIHTVIVFVIGNTIRKAVVIVMICNYIHRVVVIEGSLFYREYGIIKKCHAASCMVLANWYGYFSEYFTFELWTTLPLFPISTSRVFSLVVK